MKNDAKLTDEDKARTMFERQFLANLFEAYLKILNSIPREGNFEIILIFFFFFKIKALLTIWAKRSQLFIFYNILFSVTSCHILIDEVMRGDYLSNLPNFYVLNIIYSTYYLKQIL